MADFQAFQQAQGPSVTDFQAFQAAQGPSVADFEAFQQQQEEDAEATGLTGALVETMLANPDPKFQNSKFLRFVTRLNKGELVIQGNTIIEKAPELDAAAADARSEAMKANMLSDFAAFQQAQGPSVADFAQFQQAQGPSAADFAAFQATQGPSAADFAAFQATQGPSAADFAAFQATQGPSAADFAAFQAAQGPSAADFAQFQAAQGPSAADFVSPHIQRLACRIRADPFCPPCVGRIPGCSGPFGCGLCVVPGFARAVCLRFQVVPAPGGRVGGI